MNQLTTRNTFSLGALAVVSMSMAAHANEDAAREYASRLRAQPYSTEEPAWLVERADNTSLNLSVLSQTRYTYSTRESEFVNTNNTETVGFAQPRTQIRLDGTIVSSQLNYSISFDMGDAELSRGRGNGPALEGGTGSPILLDAYAQYNFTGKQEGYYLKLGQFQNVFLTEEAIDSSMQLAADRSLISELFGPGYTQGIALGRVTDTYAWEFSINDGGRFIGKRESDNTTYDSPDEADLGLTFRYDWKIQGGWDQFSDFTSWRGSHNAARLGAGVMYQFTGQGNPGEYQPPFLGAEAESGQYVTWTLDYQYESDGWSFFAAYTGMWVDFEFSAGTLGSQHNALQAQVGYFLSEKNEVYARFEAFWIDKDYRNGFGLDNGYIHRFLTLGTNYYFIPESHAIKFTADVSYAMDTTAVISVGGDSIGLPDPNVTGFLGLTEEELVVRAQLQLMF